MRAELPLRVEWAPDPGTVAAAIGDERLIGLYTFWLGLDASPLLPAPGAVSPADLLQVWPSMVIVDLEGRRARYRMVGSDVAAKLGIDLSGRYLDEVSRGRRLALLEGLYELCREARAAVYSQIHLAPPGEAVVVHRLMLPLSADGVTVQSILCGQTYRRPGRVPGAIGALAARARDEAGGFAWVDAAQAEAMQVHRARALRRSAA